MKLLQKVESDCNIPKKNLTKKTLQALLEERTSELKILKEELADTNNTKGVFLTNINHEIRTPLNGIVGMVQLLNMTELSDEQKDCVRIIKSSSDDLLVIINNLLEITRIQTGMIKISEESFPIRDMVCDIISCLDKSLKSKQIKLSFNVSEVIPEMVSGDKFYLRQILVNLVGNAVKFTHNGEVILDIDIEDNNAGTCSPFLKFTVSDTGIGIEKSKLPYIFDLFTQAEYLKIKNYNGTGLGLAITKRLVELMKGKITVDSKLGVGTTVVCHIPFK